MQRLVKFLKFWDYHRSDISVLTVKTSHFYARDPSLLADIPSPPDIFRTGSLDPFRLRYLFRRSPGTDSGVTGAPRESGSFLRRMAQIIFLPDSRIPWAPFALLKIARIHRKKPIDMLLASMPPFTAGIIALLANRWLKIPYILEFRDSWTDNPYLPAGSRIHQRLNHRIELKAVHGSQATVFVNPMLRAYYHSRYPVLNSRQSVVIRNGFDPEDFSRIKPVGKSSDRNVLQIGIMGTVYSQGNVPLPLLSAVKRFQESNPTRSDQIKLIFIGKWTREFEQLLKTHPVSQQIERVAYLPHREALQYAARLDALALAIDSGSAGSGNVTPGRIYEYLNLRRPILAMCPLESDLADLVRTCHAGEVVDYHDVRALERILQRWVTDHNSRKVYRFENIDQYSRKIQTAQLMAFLEQVIHEGPV